MSFPLFYDKDHESYETTHFNTEMASMISKLIYGSMDMDKTMVDITSKYNKFEAIFTVTHQITEGERHAGTVGWGGAEFSINSGPVFFAPLKLL